MIRRLLAAGALSCVLAAPAMAQQVDDSATTAAGGYRPILPTEALNPACPNAGPGGSTPGPGVVGKTYGGTVCPPAGGASTITASLGAFAPTGQVALSATTTSSNVALGSAGPTAVITNGGASTAYITFGGAGVTANTSGYPVPAGWVVALSNGANTYVAAVSASGADALTITTGTGLPAFAAPGPAGGGGAVTISGTLPAFASPPTFNFGTLNGAATAANQATQITAEQTTATNSATQATATNQATANASLATIATNTGPKGLGAMALVPTATTNGTALGSLPSGAIGARFYLGSTDTVTFTVAATAPSSAPARTFTISGASSGTGPNWDENLSGGEMIYITAQTGAPQFRWF